MTDTTHVLFFAWHMCRQFMSKCGGIVCVDNITSERGGIVMCRQHQVRMWRHGTRQNLTLITTTSTMNHYFLSHYFEYT